MSKKITFFILNNTEAPTHQATVSKNFLSLIFFLVIACFGICLFVGYDYYFLKKTSVDFKLVKQKSVNQKETIKYQQKQIQLFTKKINDIKTQFLNLKSFEEKICIVANIKNTSKEDPTYGIGGSISTDIIPEISLSEKHNLLIRKMHEQTDQLLIASFKQENIFDNILKKLNEQKNLLASTPSIRPVKGGWISSGFGYRTSPFTGRREFHRGLDIANKNGTPVYATADGTITYAGKKGYYGNFISIKHGYGLVTRYGHLSKILKKRGTKVKRGDIIGNIGNTGRSTGPHIHYEVKINKVAVNPLKYILN